LFGKSRLQKLTIRPLDNTKPLWDNNFSSNRKKINMLPTNLPENRVTLPHIVIEPPKGWAPLELDELWHSRELFYFLTWRDIKVRYKQTALGAAWAILQPVLTMVVFSIIFGGLAKLPSNGIPYPIFTFTALLPWQLFTFALTNSSNSLVGSQHLISKVYFPRLIIPLSSVLAGVIDFIVAFGVLLVMMAYYSINLTPAAFLLPLFTTLALVSAMAAGLWLSALNVQYRDIRYVVPFLTQFWMYATPIAYSSELIPEKWRWLYSLNPMTGVVEGFRWAILGKSSLDLTSLILSSIVVIALFIGGLYYFKRMEAGFADII
jgi:lipopolysaccharide transport system permease protein